MLNRRLVSKLVGSRITGLRSLSNASNLTVFGFAGSQPTRAVLMLLQGNNIPFNFKVVNALKLETKAPEFLAINPTGQVPAIKDDKVGVLAESAAILQYLAEDNNLSQWYPSDAVTRAKISFWLHWNHTNTRTGTMAVLLGNLFPAKFGPGLDGGVKKYTRAIKYLESSLNPGKFVAGTDKPTIADLALIVECDQLSHAAYGFFDFAPYPKVSAWMKAVQETVPSYKEIFEPIVVSATKFNAKKAGGN